MLSQNRYVDIISGVAAANDVDAKDLILRVITQNAAIPPGVVAEFSDHTSVGAYFGLNSEEYKRAAKYFGFVNKVISSPRKLSFSRWVSAALAPTVVGDSSAKSLASLTAISTGTLSISVDGVAETISSINLSAATSFALIASIVQTAIRTSVTPQLASATVTYNATTGQFILTGTTAGSGSIIVTATGAAGDISTLLGWGTTDTVYVEGQAADSALEAVISSKAISNNFGSFLYAPASARPTVEGYTAVAEWNDANNNEFMMCVPVKISGLSAMFGAIGQISGTAISVLSDTAADDFIDQFPAEIMAATDWSRAGASQNYMYYQDNSRNVTVQDDTTANTVESLRGNFIGLTQVNGARLAFYQPGLMCGQAGDALQMGVYASEMWLKSSLSGDIISKFLNSPSVPANSAGESDLLAAVQPTITMAIINGTFLPGKVLSNEQKASITQITGDTNAWRQVYNNGYWINFSFEAYTDDNTGTTMYKAKYILVYSKGDSIRLVEGSNVLI